MIGTPQRGPVPITIKPLSSQSDWIPRSDLNSLLKSRIARLLGCRNDGGLDLGDEEAGQLSL
jgi:hypothetical protein